MSYPGYSPGPDDPVGVGGVYGQGVAGYGLDPYGQDPGYEYVQGYQPPVQQPYGAMGGYPYVPPQPTNTLSVVALVCGIIGLVGCGLVFPAPIAAVVCGHMSIKQIGTTGESGKGMAIAGLVTGYIGLTFLGLCLLYWIGILAVVGSGG